MLLSAADRGDGSLPASPKTITLGSGFVNPSGIAIRRSSIPNVRR
jgi:hypothetical protein